MTFFAYIFICLGFIVIQTTLFPLFAWLTDFYDLLIPFVVYLGLFRPLKEGLPVVFFLGLTMDTLSGGAFGIYSTTYFWLYACIAWLIGILHFKNNLLLPFIVVVGVLMENLVFLGTIMLGNPGGTLPQGHPAAGNSKNLGDSDFMGSFYRAPAAAADTVRSPALA